MKNTLFTPGPLNCHEEVHAAMQCDVGSRDLSFIEIVSKIRQGILKVGGLAPGDGYTAVPMQGSGTFGIESAITTLVGRDQKILVLENGAYGKRILAIARRSGREMEPYRVSPTECHDPAKLEQILQSDSSISHVAVVHCETTTGILNPLEQIAEVAKGAGRTLIVDAMSSFGGIPIDVGGLDIDCLVSSANKCLESVPGFSFVIVKEILLRESKGNCSSLSLDLHDQWVELESSGQFRFTPPTHCVLAFHRALELFFEEGGSVGRERRYRNNHSLLISGMKNLGFEPVIDSSRQSPIITAFPFPEESDSFDFNGFYQQLTERGLTIYPGKLDDMECFRIGTIGQIFPEDVTGLLENIRGILGGTGKIAE